MYCLIHGVEHLVAILYLVLVWETDHRQLSLTFILCIHISKFINYCVYFQNNVHAKINTILNTESYLVLHDNFVNTYNMYNW